MPAKAALTLGFSKPFPLRIWESIFMAMPCYETVTMNAILIIDDSPLDSVQLRDSLFQLGVENPVRILQSGEAGREYLEGSGEFGERGNFPLPSVIFSDVRMPGIGGFGLLKWIKAHKQFRNIPVISVSAPGDLEAIRTSYQLGAISYLVKPARLEDLENLIQAYPKAWLRRA
jgi:CheY-like chemotaxis protein